MSSYFNTAKKLQRAINTKFKLKILVNTTQWYSDDKDVPINMYTVRQVLNNEKGKKATVELFKTYSTIQLVLFMRDFWYELNDWEIPTDNPRWEELKQRYGRTKRATSEEPIIEEETKRNEE